MLGLTGLPSTRDGKRIVPMTGHGVQCMSVGFLVDQETPMVWRGPMVTQALMQLIGDTDWEDLDYLIVDMPPGTGDAQLTMAQRVALAGAGIVPTPQDIALIDESGQLIAKKRISETVAGFAELTDMCAAAGDSAVDPIAVAIEIGVDFATAARALAKFSGIHGRFEIKGENAGRIVLDDYAHHPAEVRATLAAAALAVSRGVKVVRAHDVLETVRAMRVADALVRRP